MKNNIVLAAAIFLLTSFSCKKTDDNNNSTDCSTVICTLELRSITLQVTDAVNNPVILDEYYTVRLSNNDTINMGSGASNMVDTGYYVIVDDGFQMQLQNKTDNFKFYGFQNNNLVVEEAFIISADCCHVNKESGKSKVTLP